MTNKQRILLLVLLGIVAATLLYPPMHVVSLYGDRALGRHWIFDRPYDIARIDFGALVVEWIFIGIAIGAIYIAKPLLKQNQKVFFQLGISTLRLIRALIALFLLRTGVEIFLLYFELLKNNPNYDRKEWASALGDEVILLIFSILIFLFLRKIINFAHLILYGTPHPKMIKVWNI